MITIHTRPAPAANFEQLVGRAKRFAPVKVMPTWAVTARRSVRVRQAAVGCEYAVHITRFAGAEYELEYFTAKLGYVPRRAGPS